MVNLPNRGGTRNHQGLDNRLIDPSEHELAATGAFCAASALPVCSTSTIGRPR